jgi:arabinofuranan 3-O-arabinosyltransferase
VDGVPQPLPVGGAPVRIATGTTVSAYSAVSGATTEVQFGPLGDCDRHSAAPVLALTRPDPHSIQLSAADDAACVSGAVRPVPGTVAYRVRLDVRSVSGAPPRLCLWREDTGCLTLNQPGYEPGNGWQHYEAVAVPPPGPATPLQLFLYADGPAGLSDAMTVVRYRDVRVDGLALAGQATLTGQAAPETTLSLAAGVHHVAFGAALSGHQLGAFSTLQDCFTDATKADKRHTYSTANGVMRLTSVNGTACVRAAAGGPVAASWYHLGIDYRTASGQPARICVWEDGPNRCATVPALSTSGGWQHLDTTFRIDPGTRGLFLYLYADGGAAAATAVEYRAPTLRPTLSTVLVAAQADVAGAQSPSTLTQLASRPDRVRVRVRELRGTRVLVFTDSYAAGWHLKGLPASWHATHVVADGYANGWILTGDGDATLTLAYRPALPGYLAEYASAGAAACLALAWLVGVVRRRLPRNSSRSRRFPYQRTPVRRGRRWAGRTAADSGGIGAALRRIGR